MEYHELGKTGLKVSKISFGTAPFGNAYGIAEDEEINQVVRLAIENGINFFDSSPYYGTTLAETRLGTALKGLRNETILMTKCGRYGLDDFDFSAARLHKSIDESLERLQTDHVDILLAHDIEFGDMNQVLEETIPALEAIKKQGKARHIGVSGLPLGVLQQAIETGKVEVIISYCHYNLLIKDLDTRLAPVAKKYNVGLINASPLHMGMLTNGGAPEWHPAPQAVKQAARKMVAHCETRGVALPDVAMRMALDYDGAASTLVGMLSCSELKQNMKTLNSVSDPELLAELRAIAGEAFDQTWPSGRPENSDVPVLPLNLQT